jgi:hypothetical protein
MSGGGASLSLLAFEALWRCDGCAFEQITPHDDPPSNCPRCHHPSMFWVRSGPGRASDGCRSPSSKGRGE